MKISEMNWPQVEAYLKQDDRAILPLGSTEQHAWLSLSVDFILSERVVVEAAERVGVPVFPVVAYGITPYFLAYPGSVACVSRPMSPSCATSSTASIARASAASSSSTGMAATSRPGAWRRSGWSIIPMPP